MSFILDALKKSETERQRSSGPALFEVKVAAPQARLPTWAVIVGALLAVNLLILLWVLLHRGSTTTATQAAAAANTTPAAAGAANPTPAANPPAAPAPLAQAVAPAATPAPNNAGPIQANTTSPVNAAPTRTAPPPADESAAADEAAYNPNDERPAVLPGTAEAAAAERERARAQRALEENAERVREQQQTTASAARRQNTVMARTSGLPTRDELVNSGRARIPELSLSLHAYDPDPARRFVFINGSRAREGDAVGGGVVLETITRDGVILSSGGQKFVLTVQ